MKRTRSFIEGQDSAGTGNPAVTIAGATLSVPAGVDLLSLRQIPLALVKPEAQRPTASTEQLKELADTATACSRGAWTSEQSGEHEGKLPRHGRDANAGGSACKDEIGGLPEQTVVHRVAGSDQLSLRDIACGPIDTIAERMHNQPDEVAEELKAELREILNGNGGNSQREGFSMLQNLVLSRRDLFPESMTRANRNQLQILVALKTGIQAFLHPDISVTQTILIEVFFHKRCRNMACQSQLPADDCTCEVCTTKSGFCNVCMCTICSKFDFDVNTCRWIGCDVCSHWTHTDCAIRVHQITMGVPLKRKGGSPEMLFNCRACKHTSELLGWVKDVFRTCAGEWGTEELMKEFDSVRRIFHGSEDAKGRKLFRKSEELLDRLKNGADAASVCNEIKCFFQGLEVEDNQEYKSDDTKIIEPQEACNKIAEVVQEAVAKMEAVAQEKARALKKARLALETSDKELEEKKRELQSLQIERQRKKQEIEELETIVKLKLAESEMFQMRADEARQEAENLQKIVADKSEKAEEEYTARYLQLRLNEVEAERRALFEKIQQQDHSRSQTNGPSQMAMMGKLQDLIKRVYSQDLKETSASGL